jgi:hypothetical protein
MKFIFGKLTTIFITVLFLLVSPLLRRSAKMESNRMKKAITKRRLNFYKKRHRRMKKTGNLGVFSEWLTPE